MSWGACGEHSKARGPVGDGLFAGDGCTTMSGGESRAAADKLASGMSGPTLSQLGWLVARNVNGTLGGGVASMELLRRSFGRAGWLDARGHALLIAASRLTPGTTVLAYCVGLGWRFHRWPGVLLSLAVSSIPVALMVGGLMATLVRIDDIPAVQVVQAIGVLVATGLVFTTAWQLLRPFLAAPTRRLTAIVVLLTVVLILADVPPVRAMLAAAVLAALLPVPPEGPADPDSGEAATSGTAARAGGPAAEVRRR